MNTFIAVTIQIGISIQELTWCVQYLWADCVDWLVVFWPS